MTTPTTTPAARPALDEDAVRAFWSLLGTLISTGLPSPAWADISPDGEFASLGLRRVEDVTAWADALDAPAPEVYAHRPAEPPQRLLTSTRIWVTVAAGTWLTVYHLHVEYLDDLTDDRDGAGVAGRCRDRPVPGLVR